MITHKYSFFFRVITLSIIALFTQSLFAAPVLEQTARKVAFGFLSSQSPLRTEAKLSLVYTGDPHPQNVLRGDTSSPLYYIYNIGNQEGFIIVSGEDKAYPILGYAMEGSFLAEAIPDNITSWLDFYQDELLFVTQQEREAAGNIKQQWADMLGGQRQEIAPGVLLSTVNWDQGNPYNKFCPDNLVGEKTVTGCVATAMGITMKYYNWPLEGKGSNAYETKTDSIPVEASFNVRYDWGNMLDTYKAGEEQNWNETQSDAVATFLYHCGVSVNMDYTSSASGAYTSDVLKALVNNFGYDKSMSLLSRNLYTTEEWHDLIRKELENDSPVMYGGTTKDLSGHLFIVDGYALTDDYFHVNWGWSGYSNGYYRLSSMEPSWQGIGGNQSGAGYSYYQDAIVGLKKAERKSYINNELYFIIYTIDEMNIPGWNRRRYGLLTDVENIIKGEPFTLYHTLVMDYGDRDFDGEFAVFLEDKDGKTKELLGRMDIVGGLPSGYVMWEEEGIPLVVETDVEEGDCVTLYYRPTGYDWRPLRGERGTITHLPVLNEQITHNNILPAKEEIYTEIKDNQLYIYNPSGVDIQLLSVYTMDGKEVMRKQYQTEYSPVTLDLSRLQNQMVIVSIQTSEGAVSRKIRVH